MQIKNYRLVFGCYLFFLFLAAVIPINDLSSTHIDDIFVIDIRLDYLLHSGVFIPWAYLYLQIFNSFRKKSYLLMFATGVLMSTFTEGIQYFLTYRSYNINDLMANYLGVIIGSVIMLIGFLVKPKAYKKGSR